MEGDLILISRFVIEAQTPICISAGSDDTISHAITARDVNQLPYIPASTIKGVIFKELDISRNKKNDIIIPYISFTDALMTNECSRVIDGRKNENIFKGNQNYLGKFERLPIRHHATTNSKGSSSFDTKGINNEQVIYKGTRFVFEIEMRYDSDSMLGEDFFDEIIRLLTFSPIRFGRGSRRGFGKIKLVKCLRAQVHMNNEKERTEYLKKSGKLDAKFSLFEEYSPKPDVNVKTDSKWRTYTLSLTPRDFFIFGATTEEENIDYHSAIEYYIEWEEFKGAEFKKGYLIPASAIKGALHHRTIYHYCKLKEIYEDNSSLFAEVDNMVGQLFGGRMNDSRSFKKGNIILSDIFIPKNDADDIYFNNIGIDRLTGKQFERAFYSQKVTRLKNNDTNNPIKIEIYVKEDVVEEDVIKAFRKSLKDVCKGRLALGRGNNLGMGFFEGCYVIK